MFITHFDKKYFKWGLILIDSFLKHYKEERLYVSAVNLDKEMIELIDNMSDNVLIKNEIIDLDTLPLVKTRARWGGTIAKHLPEFMACRKSFVLQDCFEEFPEEELFVLLDADIFINKYHNFNDFIKDVDGAFLLGGDSQALSGGIHTEIMSGVIAVKNSPRGKFLVDNWVFLIKNKKQISQWRQWEWFWDQLTLNIAFKNATQENFCYKPLPHHLFVNSNMSEEAYMWSAHSGPPAKKEETFHQWVKKNK